MKLSECPEKYKIYVITMSNKSEYEVNGEQKMNIVNASTQWVDLPSGTSINKNFAVEIRLSNDRTRENVLKYADEINALDITKALDYNEGVINQF